MAGDGSHAMPEPGGVNACAGYLRPYRSAVDRIGPRFEALLWNSHETQRLRFEAITSMIDLSGLVVLDAGCGRADLGVWLKRQRVSYKQYVGIDAIPEMVEQSRTMGLTRADFAVRDFIAEENAFVVDGAAPDVIVFSGSLNTVPKSLSIRTLDRAWRACRTALVFNFLSSASDAGISDAVAGTAQRLSPVAVMQWALERTDRIAMRHDYLEGRDGTVVMRRASDALAD